MINPQDDIRILLAGLGVEVEHLSEEALEHMLFEIHRFGLDDSGNLLETIRQRVKYQSGVPDSIGFKFPRTGIYPIHGAGTGHGGSVGSKWRTSKGAVRTTNPASLGKAGSGPFKRMDWISTPFDILEKQLSDTLEKYYGEATIKALRP